MNFMQILVVIVAGLMLIWFIAPIVIWRILNVGNLLGILCSTGVILTSIFWKSFSNFICSFWTSIGGKICISGVAVILTLGIVFGGTMSVLMTKSASNAPKKGATAVVLGCRVYGTNPSLMLVQRMDKAIDYLEKNPEAKAVLSGGQGEGEDISEAEAMRVYITSKGIDENRLFIEDKSTNTDENISFSEKIIEQEKMDNNMAIVSQEFHLYRANIIAKKNEISASSLPARTNIILLPTYWVREVLALVEETILK